MMRENVTKKLYFGQRNLKETKTNKKSQVTRKAAMKRGKCVEKSIKYQVSSINFISIKHYIKIHQDKKKRHIYNKIICRSTLESQ